MLRLLSLAALLICLVGCGKDTGWKPVTEDDPRLEAARQQARDSFDDFRKLIRARQPMSAFTVEVRYEDGAESEYITLDVRAVTDTEISGTVVGYPQKVKLKNGEPVTVPVANLSDWRVEMPNGEVQGGFVDNERAKLQRGG